MHAFASPTPEATPVWLVSADAWEGIKIVDRRHAATAFAERCGFKPKAGRSSFFRATAGRSPASCSASMRRARRRAIRSPPASSRRRCPKASIASPTRLADADLAALGFLLGALSLRPVQGRFGAEAPARRARRRRRGADRAHRGGGRLRTRSRQRAGQRARAARARAGRRSSSPSISTPASGWSAATSFSPPISAHPRGRPRGRRGAADRRLRLGT